MIKSWPILLHLYPKATHSTPVLFWSKLQTSANVSQCIFKMLRLFPKHTHNIIVILENMNNNIFIRKYKVFQFPVALYFFVKLLYQDQSQNQIHTLWLVSYFLFIFILKFSSFSLIFKNYSFSIHISLLHGWYYCDVCLYSSLSFWSVEVILKILMITSTSSLLRCFLGRSFTSQDQIFIYILCWLILILLFLYLTLFYMYNLKLYLLYYELVLQQDYFQK